MSGKETKTQQLRLLIIGIVLMLFAYQAKAVDRFLSFPISSDALTHVHPQEDDKQQNMWHVTETGSSEGVVSDWHLLLAATFVIYLLLSSLYFEKVVRPLLASLPLLSRNLNCIVPKGP